MLVASDESPRVTTAANLHFLSEITNLTRGRFTNLTGTMKLVRFGVKRTFSAISSLHLHSFNIISYHFMYDRFSFQK